MATRGTPLDAFTLARLLRLRREGASIYAAAKDCRIDIKTARRYIWQAEGKKGVWRGAAA